MCAHNPSEQVRARKDIAGEKFKFLVNAMKSVEAIGLSFNFGVLMQYAG